MYGQQRSRQLSQSRGQQRTDNNTEKEILGHAKKVPAVQSTRSVVSDTAGTVFYFYGNIIPLEDPINGWYIEQPYLINDRALFIRQTNGPDSDPMTIWYMPSRTVWTVTNRSKVGTETFKAAGMADVQHPEQVHESTLWKVFSPQRNTYVDVPNQRFVPASENQLEQEVIQHKIKVSGRLGYNRAMNGIYVRGDNVHCGKSYYEHEDNEFTIRWYQTKWVVDWREGLHDDNVGAAVNKEDVPEPWMCAGDWRIYDGKAKQKKWGYDTLVQITPQKVFDSKNSVPFE